MVYLLRAPIRPIESTALLFCRWFSSRLRELHRAFPRQSLDAVRGAFAFAAAFYVGRDVTANPLGSRATLAMLRLLSVAVTTLFVAQVAAVNIEWIQLSPASSRSDCDSKRCHSVIHTTS